MSTSTCICTICQKEAIPSKGRKLFNRFSHKYCYNCWCNIGKEIEELNVLKIRKGIENIDEIVYAIKEKDFEIQELKNKIMELEKQNKILSEGCDRLNESLEFAHMGYSNNLYYQRVDEIIKDEEEKIRKECRERMKQQKQYENELLNYEVLSSKDSKNDNSINNNNFPDMYMNVISGRVEIDLTPNMTEYIERCKELHSESYSLDPVLIPPKFPSSEQHESFKSETKNKGVVIESSIITKSQDDEYETESENQSKSKSKSKSRMTSIFSLHPYKEIDFDEQRFLLIPKGKDIDENTNKQSQSYDSKKKSYKRFYFNNKASPKRKSGVNNIFKRFGYNFYRMFFKTK